MTPQDPSQVSITMTEEELAEFLDEMLERIEATEDDQHDPSIWEQK
jgi:CRISPR/Cas system CSM-associated protein Csm2 small subunit